MFAVSTYDGESLHTVWTSVFFSYIDSGVVVIALLFFQHVIPKECC